jgi:ABC-type lipoprotein release transport system permease subunit
MLGLAAVKRNNTLPAYELIIGLRYTRAKRRNHFISFISMISMGGMALGVAALIVVLSVMNGFQEELRTRILASISHVEIRGVGQGGGLTDWPSVAIRAPRTRRARERRASTFMHVILVSSILRRTCATNCWSACAIRAPSVATTSSASFPSSR